MPTFTGSIILSAPPGFVFPYLHEEKKLKRWVQGFVETIPQSLGEFGENFRSIDVVQEAGQRIEMETIIREFIPPETIVFSSSNDHIETRTKFELAPTPDGCTLSMSLEANAKGMFASVKSMFINTMLHERSQQNLDQLKQVIQQDYVNPSTSE